MGGLRMLMRNGDFRAKRPGPLHSLRPGAGAEERLVTPARDIRQRGNQKSRSVPTETETTAAEPKPTDEIHPAHRQALLATYVSLVMTSAARAALERGKGA